MLSPSSLARMLLFLHDRLAYNLLFEKANNAHDSCSFSTPPRPDICQRHRRLSSPCFFFNFQFFPDNDRLSFAVNKCHIHFIMQQIEPIHSCSTWFTGRLGGRLDIDPCCLPTCLNTSQELGRQPGHVPGTQGCDGGATQGCHRHFLA